MDYLASQKGIYSFSCQTYREEKIGGIFFPLFWN